MLSDSLKHTLALKAETYHDQLKGRDNPTPLAGIEYLASRMIANYVGKYQLGVVAEPLPGDEPYKGMLVIPYLTLAGVRGLKYRCIQDHKCKDHGHPKYNQPHGQAQRLYNALAYFGGHDMLGVCEGEIDAITATEHLGLPTVGIPGASQWQKQGKYWSLVLKDFSTIVVFADGDPPGKQLAAVIAADAGPGSRLVICDDGEDINSMVRAGKADELKRKAGL